MASMWKTCLHDVFETGKRLLGSVVLDGLSKLYPKELDRKIVGTLYQKNWRSRRRLPWVAKRYIGGGFLLRMPCHGMPGQGALAIKVIRAVPARVEGPVHGRTRAVVAGGQRSQPGITGYAPVETPRWPNPVFSLHVGPPRGQSERN
ncbi:hypothetical protein MRX96_045333 [Rhipicephalus microplus]